MLKYLNVLVGHLDNFFGEMLSHYTPPLFIWVIALFIVDLNVFIIYFWIQHLYQICITSISDDGFVYIFSPFCGVDFTFY